MAEKTVRIFEVLFASASAGPAGDGHHVRRFRSLREAEAFAKPRSCYGHPATVETVDAPLPLARRWGLA